MNNTVILILTRHGETLENRKNILMGQMPGVLSPTGICQAQALAEKQKGRKIDVVVCSDLARSLDTAVIAAAPHGLTPEPTPLLREMDWGVFTGGTLEEIDWFDLPENVESLEAIYLRVEKLIGYLKEKYAGKTVLAVGHGAVNRVITAFLQGKDAREMVRMPIMSNAACIEFVLR